MGYLLQSIPVFAAYLCYANAAIRVQGQFLSDFIKEMIEAIKPAQLHPRDTHLVWSIYTKYEGQRHHFVSYPSQKSHVSITQSVCAGSVSD